MQYLKGVFMQTKKFLVPKKLFIFILTVVLVSLIKTFSFASEPFSFIVYGDSRPPSATAQQPPINQRIIEEANLLGSDFIINVGDMVWGYMSSEEEAVRQYKDLMVLIKKCEIPFYPVVGNHDVASKLGEKLYLENFPNKLYYSFNYQGSHFIILDTDIGGPTGEVGEKQIEWLKKDLEENKQAENIFAFMHRPMYFGDDVLPDLSEGEFSRKTSWAKEAELKTVEKLFLDYKVQYVFAGHIHLYSKLKKDGITYYVTGGGGAESVAPQLNGFAHYLLVRVNGTKVSVDVIEPYHFYTEYLPDNSGKNKSATVVLVNTLKSGMPIKFQGISLNMPKLQPGEDYKVSGGKIIKQVENKNYNTLTFSAFVRGFGNTKINVEVIKK